MPRRRISHGNESPWTPERPEDHDHRQHQDQVSPLRQVERQGEGRGEQHHAPHPRPTTHAASDRQDSPLPPSTRGSHAEPSSS